MSTARVIAFGLVLAFAVSGVVVWKQNLNRPGGAGDPQVADAPAGGRTQADAMFDSTHGTVIQPPGDPLEKGIPESPDIPPDHAHMGVKKAGERIRAAVLEDGTVGDEEVPGVSLAGLTAKQRSWFLDHAVELTCPCGCKQDLLECRRDDDACPTSPGLRDSLLTEARKQR